DLLTPCRARDDGWQRTKVALAGEFLRTSVCGASAPCRDERVQLAAILCRQVDEFDANQIPIGAATIRYQLHVSNDGVQRGAAGAEADLGKALRLDRRRQRHFEQRAAFRDIPKDGAILALERGPQLFGDVEPRVLAAISQSVPGHRVPGAGLLPALMSARL